MLIYNAFGRSFLLDFRLRNLLLKVLGADVDRRARVNPGVIIRTRDLTLGAFSTINYGCILDNRDGVHIGERVGVGIGVTFTTSTHDYSNPLVRAGAGKTLPIHIGDGAWIGSGATILAGVRVGSGAIVAAGAVVVKDVPANTVVGGTPARHIRELPVD